MTLDSIIERLEKATGPNYELEREIQEALEPDRKIHVPRPYTASVDAAIALAGKVLPGWNFTLSSRQAYVHRPCADVASDAWIEDNNNSEYAEASGGTLPIALCLVILTALKAKQMGVGE